MKRIVDVADLIVSHEPQDVLVTYALGSCLGVSAFDREAGVGGLLHCQLPTAPRDQAPRNPAQFVDSGLLTMLDQMFTRGAQKSRLVIAIAGGAEVMDNLKSFKIAHRNHAVLRKILWKNGLLIAAEDVGGDQPRTMSLDMADGSVGLQSGSRRWQLISPASPFSTATTSSRYR